MDLYPTISLALKRFPASQFNGLSGLGYYNITPTALIILSIVHYGLHFSERTSKQTSPVSKWTFGWNILVKKCNDGALWG